MMNQTKQKVFDEKVARATIHYIKRFERDPEEMDKDELESCIKLVVDTKYYETYDKDKDNHSPHLFILQKLVRNPFKHYLN